MSITINGTGSITGLTAGGLPDGSITSDDIASGAVTAAKLAAGAGGKILQVVNAIKTDTFSTSSTSFTDLTGLAASITPASNTSKVFVVISLGLSAVNAANTTTAFRLLRDSTAIFVADASGSRPQASFRTLASVSDNHGQGITFHGLDSPSSTSTITYKLQVQVQSGVTNYINRTAGDSNGTDAYQSRTASTITLMEVAA